MHSFGFASPEAMLSTENRLTCPFNQLLLRTHRCPPSLRVVLVEKMSTILVGFESALAPPKISVATMIINAVAISPGISGNGHGGSMHAMAPPKPKPSIASMIINEGSRCTADSARDIK